MKKLKKPTNQKVIVKPIVTLSMVEIQAKLKELEFFLENYEFKYCNNVIGASQNPFLYSKKYDCVIGYNEFHPNESRFVLSNDGHYIGGFDNSLGARELLNKLQK